MGGSKKHNSNNHSPKHNYDLILVCLPDGFLSSDIFLDIFPDTILENNPIAYHFLCLYSYKTEKILL